MTTPDLAGLCERLRASEPFYMRGPDYEPHMIEPSVLRLEAAAAIERLVAVLDGLLTEAEDVFVCMADATGIDRHNFPAPFIAARTALSQPGPASEGDGE